MGFEEENSPRYLMTIHRSPHTCCAIVESTQSVLLQDNIYMLIESETVYDMKQGYKPCQITRTLKHWHE